MRLRSGSSVVAPTYGAPASPQVLKLSADDDLIPGTRLAADASWALMAVVSAAVRGGDPLSERAWLMASTYSFDRAARSAVVKERDFRSVGMRGKPSGPTRLPARAQPRSCKPKRFSAELSCSRPMISKRFRIGGTSHC